MDLQILPSAVAFTKGRSLLQVYPNSCAYKFWSGVLREPPHVALTSGAIKHEAKLCSSLVRVAMCDDGPHSERDEQKEREGKRARNSDTLRQTKIETQTQTQTLTDRCRKIDRIKAHDFAMVWFASCSRTCKVRRGIPTALFSRERRPNTCSLYPLSRGDPVPPRQPPPRT